MRSTKKTVSLFQSHVFKHEFFLFPVARSLFPLKNNDLLSRLALKIVFMARQKARGFGRFYVSLHSLVLLCSPTDRLYNNSRSHEIQ